MNPLDYQVYSSYQYPRVVETKKGFLLNGHYYDKQKIEAIPMQYASLNDAIISKDTLQIKSSQTLDIGWNYGYRHNSSKIVTDPYLEDTYYTVVGNTTNQTTNNHRLFSFTEKNNTIVCNFVIGISNCVCMDEIVDINKDFIYVTGYHDTSTCVYLYRINKSTKVIDQCFQLAIETRPKLHLIYKDDNYLYLFVNTRWDGFNFYRYNKTTHSVTVKPISYSYTSTGAKDKGTYIFENLYEKDGIVYIYYPYWINQDDGLHFCVRCIKFNIHIDVTQNTYETFIAIDTQTSWKNYTPNRSEIFRVWIIDNILYIAFYDDDYSENRFDAINTQCLHTFKILDDNTLEYISSNQIDTKNQIISMCFSSDKKIINLGFWHCCKIMKLNETTKQYETVSDRFMKEISSTGFDEYDRIWFQYIDNSVDAYSLNDPEETNIKFERVSYVYMGYDINSYVEFSSYDFTGEHAKGIYIFELSGPCNFENGTNECRINYQSGVIQIPITVTGSEQLSCKVYYLKESD